MATNNAKDNINIAVELYKEEGRDILKFDMNPEHEHKLELNKDNQEAIKTMFCDLISLLKTAQVHLTLEVNNDYDNELMKEVAKDYVDDLNTEIGNVKAKIDKDYRDNELSSSANIKEGD